MLQGKTRLNSMILHMDLCKKRSTFALKKEIVSLLMSLTLFLSGHHLCFITVSSVLFFVRLFVFHNDSVTCLKIYKLTELLTKCYISPQKLSALFLMLISKF